MAFKIVPILGLLAIIATVSAGPAAESLPADSAFSEEDLGGLSSITLEVIANEYIKFNLELINALSEAPENVTSEEILSMADPMSTEVSSDVLNTTEPSALYSGSSTGSSFGLGQILAVIKELETNWSITPFGFDHLLNNAPDYLNEVYELVLTTMSQEDSGFTAKTKIFTNYNISTAALSQLNATLVPMNFKEASEKNVAKINAAIKGDMKGKVLLNYDYIPEGMPIPESTQAVLVNSIIFSETWEMPWKKLGKRNFTGYGEVEMMEIEGSFPYLESDRAIEVSIPVKNDSSRTLSLILPRSIEDALTGNLGDARNGSAKSVRIILPAFNFTFRSPHYDGVGSGSCAAEMKTSFLNTLSDLTYISWNSEGISAAAITGVQIQNTKEYEEFLRSSISNNKTTSAVVEEVKKKVLQEAASDSVETSSAEVSSDESSYSTSTESSSIEKSEEPLEEKLIVFDRPFTWTIIDENVFSVPLFSGAVESFPTYVDLTKILGSPKYFGPSQHFRYNHCFKP